MVIVDDISAMALKSKEKSEPAATETPSASTSKPHNDADDDDAKWSRPSTSGTKRKTEQDDSNKKVAEKKAKKGGRDVWVGVDLSDSDLESSSDEEGEGSEGKEESA